MLDMKKSFFTQRVGGLLREVVAAARLTAFKCLDNTVRHMV